MGLPMDAFDQPRTVGPENQLVHSRRGELEISLHVRLGGWPTAELREDMIELQLLTLRFGEPGREGVRDGL